MEAKILKALMDKKCDRLESLRIPRDLSLGGTKPKKLMEPNVKRLKKKKSTINVEEAKPTKKEKNKPQPRKRPVDNKRFVQSQGGIFAEGVVDSEKRPSVSFGGYRAKSERDPSTSMQIPTFRKTDSSADNDNDTDMLSSLITMKLEHPDGKLDNADTWDFISNRDVAVKVEEGTVDPYFCKMEDNERHGRVAVIKMPESLAGRPLTDDPKGAKNLDYNLNMMTEGKIGTLQITSSGKVYMKIGLIRYLMQVIQSTAGPEEIGSYTEPPAEGSNGKFSLLGDVERRFQLIPEWTEL